MHKCSEIINQTLKLPRNARDKHFCENISKWHTYKMLVVTYKKKEWSWKHTFSTAGICFKQRSRLLPLHSDTLRFSVSVVVNQTMETLIIQSVLTYAAFGSVSLYDFIFLNVQDFLKKTVYIILMT